MSETDDQETDGQELVIKFLHKLTKKSKGTVDVALARRVFGEMPGWSLEETTTAFEVARSHDAVELVKSRIPGARFMRRDYDPLRDKIAKTLSVGFESEEDVEPGRRWLENHVIVGAPPECPAPDSLYSTGLGDVVRSRHEYPCLGVGRMWMGVRGWRVSAPDGASKVVGTRFESLAGFWTFLYKHGAAADAKKALESLGSDIVALALMSKEERDRVLAMRTHLPEVARVFEELTDRRFRAVVEYMTQDMMEKAERYAEGSLPLMYVCLDLLKLDSVAREYVLKPDYKEQAALAAHRQAELARQAYLFKNTTRISAIAKRKGQIPVPTLLSETDQGVAGYGGEIRFEFEDGSSFVLRNKTIWKTSSGGVYFPQFPTTFHEVVMPDGTAMPAPSEERMLDVFTGG